MIAEFGSLAAALAAGEPAQRRATGSEAAAAFLQTVRGAVLHALRIEPGGGAMLSDSHALRAFLRADMAYLPHEQLRVLFLGADGRLVRDEVMFTGSLDECPMYARAILKRALELGAAGLILVHNHPSGDPTPSPWDITATHKITEGGKALDIALHDHIVIARRGQTSFREAGLL